MCLQFIQTDLFISDPCGQTEGENTVMRGGRQAKAKYCPESEKPDRAPGTRVFDGGVYR
jgi:hypothetical protein